MEKVDIGRLFPVDKHSQSDGIIDPPFELKSLLLRDNPDKATVESLNLGIKQDERFRDDNPYSCSIKDQLLYGEIHSFYRKRDILSPYPFWL